MLFYRLLLLLKLLLKFKNVCDKLWLKLCLSLNKPNVKSIEQYIYIYIEFFWNSNTSTKLSQNS